MRLYAPGEDSHNKGLPLSQSVFPAHRLHLSLDSCKAGAGSGWPGGPTRTCWRLLVGCPGRGQGPILSHIRVVIVSRHGHCDPSRHCKFRTVRRRAPGGPWRGVEHLRQPRLKVRQRENPSRRPGARRRRPIGRAGPRAGARNRRGASWTGPTRSRPPARRRSRHRCV